MKNILWFLAIGLCLLLAFWAVVGPLSHSAQRSGATSSASPASTAESRTSFARNLENDLTHKGIPAHVSLEGQDQSELRIEWPGISRHDIYDMVTSSTIHDQAKPLGVKTVVFADGGGSRNCGSLSKTDCEERWNYDLDRESMIWRPSPL